MNERLFALPLNKTKRGLSAQRLAEQVLKQLGFLFLAENYRTRHGEIDLIALENSTLCFIEVRSKNQTKFGEPFGSITEKKQRCLSYAAVRYLQENPSYYTVPCRFDVVSVQNGNVSLLRNAFFIEEIAAK